MTPTKQLPSGLGEWITMRRVDGTKAEMFINDAKYSTFIVTKMLGKQHTARSVCG